MNCQPREPASLSVSPGRERRQTQTGAGPAPQLASLSVTPARERRQNATDSSRGVQ